MEASDDGQGAVPTFHRFDGFRVEVRARDHDPPRFHVVGPDFHALVDIRTLAVLEGTYRRKALAEAVDWASRHGEALLAEWVRLNERG